MAEKIEIFEKENQFWTTTVEVGKRFGKQHKNVLPVMEKLKNQCSEQFWRLNYKPGNFKDARGKTQPMYELTRDGFSMLVTRFSGQKAVLWTENFIKAFNSTEKKALEYLRSKHTVEKFVLELAVKWEKRFPQLYYDGLYKVTGIKNKSVGRTTHPQCFGWMTTEIIYSRYGEQVLEELNRVNPKDGHGKRKNKIHCHLTTDIGHPALNQLMFAVLGFMNIATDYKQLIRLLDHAYPRNGTQFDLFIEE